MKHLIVVSVLLAVATAKPSGILTPVAYVAPVAVAAPVAISSQYHSQDELGQYSYGYSNPLSSKSEIKSADGITRGGYSYIDAEGKLQTVQYTSDSVNGFRVAATNLPAAPQAAPLPQPEPVKDTPEVEEAKTKHIAAVEEAKAKDAAAPAEPVQTVAAPVAIATPIINTYAAPWFGYTTYGYGYPYLGSYYYAAPIAVSAASADTSKATVEETKAAVEEAKTATS